MKQLRYTLEQDVTDVMLNSRSVALAKSIRAKDRKAHLVFTDVYEQNDEPDYELLLEARDLRALCMKKDISHVDLLERKGKVELFLIGGDESENVSQAVKITTELEKLNKKKDVKIFVFSRKQSGAYIIDSVRYDRLLADARAMEAQAVLYGHTHIADCHREEDGLWVLNPGTCSSGGGSVGLIEIENGNILSCKILNQTDLEALA